jgi:hypothetical protein
MSKPSPKNEMDHMQAHGDLRTLIEAARIHADKKRHKAAMMKHQEMQAAMNAVQQNAAQPQPAPDPNMSPQDMPPAQKVMPARPSANLGAF